MVQQEVAMAKAALIVGAGSGISASFARALARDGYRVVLAARNAAKLAELVKETGARVIEADATRAESVADLFADIDRTVGDLGVVLYNASYRTGRFWSSIRKRWQRRSRCRPSAAFLSGRRRRGAW
jgi:NAD(P)-dependent dehydrogenase (short-subunit alcohol dehydrogenase family)